LVNIFGGIMKCDVIAEGIIKAAQLVDLKLPLVVRLTGTNAVQGNKLLNDFSQKNKNLRIIVADNLDDAAVKAVSTLKK
jgi:succinyl-CoA synthetase beta subunit